MHDDLEHRFKQRASTLGLEEYIPHVEHYMEEIQSIMLEYGPLLMHHKTAEALSLDPTASTQLRSATNVVDGGNSEICAHEDKPSLFPALITGMNAAGAQRSYSKGNFLLIQGLVQVDYGAGDVLLANGSKLHAVTQLCPHMGKTKVTRFSMVHFSRKTTENPVWQDAQYLPTTLQHHDSDTSFRRHTVQPADASPVLEESTAYKCGPYNLRARSKVRKHR